MIYLILLIMTTFMSLNNSKVLKNKIIGLSFFFIFLVGFFRFDVGADYDGYVNLYYNLRRSDGLLFSLYLLKPDLIIYGTLSHFFESYNSGYIYVLGIYLAATLMIFRIVFLEHNIPNSGVSIFILLFLFGIFDRPRQFLSIAIFLWGLNDIVKRRLGVFALKLVCATAVHTSAALLLPVYFLNRIKFNLRSLMSLTILIIIVYYLNLNAAIVDFIYSNIPMYGEIYKDTEYIELGSYSTGIGFLALRVPFIYFIYRSRANPTVKTIAIFGMWLSILAGDNLNIFRFSNYLSSAMILCLPQYLQQSFSKRNYLASLLLMYLLVLGFLINMSNPTNEYLTIFSYQAHAESFRPD